MKKVATVVLLLIVAVLLFFAYKYIDFRTKNAVSDAAFIKTDSLQTLGFKVGGKLIVLTKKEGEKFKKGELLAKLDPKDLQLALHKATENLSSLEKKVDALLIKKDRVEKELALKKELAKLNLQKSESGIEAMKHRLASMRAEFDQIRRDLDRTKRLFRRHLVQKEKLEKIQTNFEVRKNEIAAFVKKIEAAKYDCQKAKKQIALIEAKTLLIKELQEHIASLVKQKAALKAAIEDLRNKISYTNLYAPFDGVVAKRYVNLNAVLKKGSPIYSVVDPKDLHVEVLLSEKKLQGVKVGNDVRISVDAYPDRTYHGKVETILPASAATFALVPRDIASGEFTKLAQRFVVRISIDNPTPDLRVGMGAGVVIKRDIGD